MEEEINTREKIFLGKLECILSTFNKLDEMFEDLDNQITEQPTNQQSIDFLLSDYYHIIENDELTDDEMINICKRIKQSRIKRRDESSTARLMSAYNTNKNKLQYAPRSTREMFKHEIKKVLDTLHEDYNYRVLTQEDLNELKDVCEKPKKGRKSKLPKKEIMACFKDNMKNKEIAEKFGINPAVVSRLRSLYGFPTRKYNKKG